MDTVRIVAIQMGNAVAGNAKYFYTLAREQD